MSKATIARIAACGSLIAASVSGQSIDFARDVQPIFRQNCVGCHGPSQQMNGLRLDRRSSVFKLGNRRVVPGNSANSFLVHRLKPSEYGPQMPPTGALKPEQVETVTRWIDQGAPWPDSLANETELPPLNPKAVAMVEALRRGDKPAFQKFVGEDAKLLNARGPDGATPFMYAVLYSPAATLAELLKKGANPNQTGDTKVTALMWAVTDTGKTRVLLNAGADVNARSDDMRTPLLIASGRPGNVATVKLLLSHGAKTDPNPNPSGQSSALIEGATAGDAEIMRTLIAGGANVKAAGEPAMAMAIATHCAKCLDLLLAGKQDKAAVTGALDEVAIFADVNDVRRLLEQGADVNAVDPAGRTPLLYAAGSDLVPLDVVKLLVERGSDVNAKVGHPNAVDTGWSVLDVARLRGNTPVVDFLIKAGARGTVPSDPMLQPKQSNNIRDAVQASLPALQHVDESFVPKAGCISCHNNSLTAMTVGLARKSGFRVDEGTAAKQVKINAGALDSLRDRLLQGFFVPMEDNFGPGIVAFMLIGLDAEHHKADLGTDTAAMYIKMHQQPDGHWAYPDADTRPPLCSDYIGETVLSMRALQLYAPVTDKAAYQKSVTLAAQWLAKATSRVNSDFSSRVMGLAWAGTDKAAMQVAVKELLATQRADGGWSEIPTMETNAFATGKALVALQTAGVPVSEAAYQRGMKFLLNTQLPDGSWYVKTRALAFQPFFDAGYPHGFDQYISSAGSNWAAMALTLGASGAPGTVAGLR
ncbi:MAG: ankyrin repeat domain-containing protein [Terriglobia bacterium]